MTNWDLKKKKKKSVKWIKSGSMLAILNILQHLIYIYIFFNVKSIKSKIEIKAETINKEISKKKKSCQVKNKAI